MSTRAKLLILLLLVVAIAAGAIVNRGEGGDRETASTLGPETGEDFADPCARDELGLLEPGVLTIGAAGPSGLHWLASGGAEPEGFGPDIVRAVAEFMFFAPEELRWVDVSREDVLASGPQGVDFAVGQIVPTAELDETMDLTESYYDLEQAVLTRPGTELADGATLVELRESRLGAPAGPSHETVLAAIQPEEAVALYDTPQHALAGLRGGDVDAVLLDYPTALELCVRAKRESWRPVACRLRATSAGASPPRRGARCAPASPPQSRTSASRASTSRSPRPGSSRRRRRSSSSS